MNYDELQLLIANYMHRTDLGGQIPGFIEIARARINRDLRVREMLVSATIIPTTNPFPAPDDFLEMRDIYWNRGTRRVTLGLVGRRQLNNFSAGTAPAFYSVDGTQLETAPGGVDTVFNLLYYGAQPPLTIATDTNETMSRFPSIWLYASLIEAHTYTQDLQLRDQALATYTQEVAAANGRAAEAESGASLNMQGASSWV